MESQVPNISEDLKRACPYCDGPLPPDKTKPHIYCSIKCGYSTRLGIAPPKPKKPDLPGVCGYCTAACDPAHEYCSSRCQGLNRRLDAERQCSRCRLPWRPMSQHRHTTRTECWNCHIDTMTLHESPDPWKGLKSYRKKKLLERAGGVCEDCGDDDRLEAHHVIPRALGGSHDLENLRLLCWECHQGKGWARNHAALIDAGLVVPAVDTQLALAA